MSSVPRLCVTPREYLARERIAETKSEYFNGAVFAMAGATRQHNVINHNIGRAIGNRLVGRPCEVYQNDMRVKVSRTGLYTYPDVAVACDPVVENNVVQGVDTLLNPRVLVEVPSKTSEGYDRGTKSAHYRQIESLQDYLIVSQDEYRVDRLSRHPDGHWSITDVAGLDASIEIPSLGIALPLAEIYDRVDLTVPEDEAAEP